MKKFSVYMPKMPVCALFFASKDLKSGARGNCWHDGKAPKDVAVIALIFALV